MAAAPAGGKIDPSRPDCALPSGMDCQPTAPGKQPDDGIHEWMSVSTAFQSYDYDATLRAIDVLTARQPFNADAAFMRGYALHRQHKDAEAIKAFDRALALDPGHAMALAQRGLSRALLGDTAQGLSDVDAALAAVAENPTAMAYRGLILIRAGRDNEGLSLLGDAADMSPDFVWLLLVKATALADLKRLDLAAADADRAAEIAPDDPSVYTVRARIRLDRADGAGALADAEKSLALGGQDPLLLVLRGRARAATGDAAGAAADAALVGKPARAGEPVPELPSLFGDGPGDPLPRLMLAVLKIENGDPRGARAIAEQVLLTAPWWRPAVLMVRAYAFQALGDHKAALADLDELESASGKTGESLYIRAKVLWDAGRRGDALATIDSALQAAPDDDLFRQTRATFHYESGDLAGAPPDFTALRPSEDYGEWAWQMQILTLYYLDRNREAAESAVPYLRADKAADDSMKRAVADMVWRLQAGATWPLADDLLAATTPPPLGEDFALFLKARSLVHAGKLAEAEALLGRIGAHDVLLVAMADAGFAPLWDQPGMHPLSDLPALYRRSFDVAWESHRAHPENLLAATYALGVVLDLGCGDAASAAATRMIPSLPRYAEQEQFGAGVFELIGANAVRHGDGAAALATWEDGIARRGADNPYTLTLTLNSASLLLGAGRFDDSLARLSRVEAISPAYEYAIVMTQYMRALAYDGLGRRKERDAALDYVAAHARGNAMAAALAIGLLRSYDEAVGLVVANLSDHAHGQMILEDLHLRPRPGPTSDLDNRERALLDRLRADPRVKAALATVGRILTLPDNGACLLTPGQLAEKPFLYPFEAPAGPQSPPISPGQ
jgi:tetratricopeptide (TPR) repeat protein